ncbi:hypothetical protein ACS0TY_030694 [Phlomoides rotata]
MIFTLVLHRWDLRWAHKSGSDVQAFSGPKIVASKGHFLYGDVVLRSDLWSRSSERVREQSASFLSIWKMSVMQRTQYVNLTGFVLVEKDADFELSGLRENAII